MNAVILSGGYGKRLMPLTKNLPKPLMTVANKPIIDYCFSQLNAYGMHDVALTLAYLPEKMIGWCRGYYDFNISYSIEQEPLGTAGGVKAIEGLDDVFIVLSGDGISDLDIYELLQTHRRSKADVTIAVTPSCTPWLYGVVDHRGGYVTDFVEKPLDARGIMDVNTGIYVVNREVLQLVPDKFFDFSKDLFPILLKEGRIGVYNHYGYWSDVGDIVSYYKANFRFKNGGFFIPAERERKMSGVFGNTLIGEQSSIVGKVTNCIIGHGCRIASGVELEDCIVLDGTIVTNNHSGQILSGDYELDIGEYFSATDKNRIFAFGCQ